MDASDKGAVAAHLGAIVDKAGPVRLMFNGVEWGDTQGQHVVDMDLERFIRPVRSGSRATLRRWPLLWGSECGPGLAWWE